jgi:hypothetical protein
MTAVGNPTTRYVEVAAMAATIQRLALHEKSAEKQFGILNYFFPPNKRLSKPGSFGSLAWPWQRSPFGTPLRAISMCWPHPDQDGFPHFLQVVRLHIFDLLIGYW